MKIIAKSEQKDYYDFVAGHDADPRKVYNRKTEYVYSPLARDLRKIDIYYHLLSQHENKNYFDPKIFEGGVWFCDKFYKYWHHVASDRYFYRFDDISKEIAEMYAYRLSKRYRNKNYPKGEKWGNLILDYFNPDKSWQWRHQADYESKPLNRQYGQPVVYSRLMEHNTNLVPTVVINGLLKDVSFSAIKTPQEAFTELYNWIPYIEPEMPSDPADMNRFENKGFDKKTSFRNIK